MQVLSALHVNSAVIFGIWTKWYFLDMRIHKSQSSWVVSDSSKSPLRPNMIFMHNTENWKEVLCQNKVGIEIKGIRDIFLLYDISSILLFLTHTERIGIGYFIFMCFQICYKGFYMILIKSVVVIEIGNILTWGMPDSSISAAASPLFGVNKILNTQPVMKQIDNRRHILSCIIHHNNFDMFIRLWSNAFQGNFQGIRPVKSWNNDRNKRVVFKGIV